MKARDRYDSLFQYYAGSHGLEWQLLKAQVLAESSGDPDALSPVGAKGLAQFMDRTWEEWRDGTPGIQELPAANLVLLDPRDPEDAIRAQAAYMAWLLKSFSGQYVLALAAYNWGIGKVKRALAEHGFDSSRFPQETRDYLWRVMDNLRGLRAEQTKEEA